MLLSVGKAIKDTIEHHLPSMHNVKTKLTNNNNWDTEVISTCV